MSIRSGQLDPQRFPHPNVAGAQFRFLADNAVGYVAAVDINGKAPGFSFTLVRRWCPGWPCSVRFSVDINSDGISVYDISGLNQFSEAKVERITVPAGGGAVKVVFTKTCFKRVDNIRLVSEAVTVAALVSVGWQMNASPTGTANQTNETAFALPCKIGSSQYGALAVTQAAAQAQVPTVLVSSSAAIAVEIPVAELTIDTTNHAIRSLTDTVGWMSGMEVSVQFYFGNGTDP